MKKYINSIFFLMAAMFATQSFSGAHVPGYVSIDVDSYNPAYATLYATMNFNHNPATQVFAYVKIDELSDAQGPYIHVAGSDGVGAFACSIHESVNAQLYADAELLLLSPPASSKITVGGINFGECGHFRISNSSVYGEDAVVYTTP